MVQIHKATAEQLRIKSNGKGFYFCSDGQMLTVKEHNEIVAKISLDLKEHYLTLLENYKNENK